MSEPGPRCGCGGSSPCVRPGTVARLGIALIRLYQISLGHLIGGQCRFQPSCSHYGVRALELHGYEVELEVTFGEPAEEIVNFVNFTPVDLVAMTTHGRTGLSKMLFGNVAEALLRRVNVPVLILRPFER